MTIVSIESKDSVTFSEGVDPTINTDVTATFRTLDLSDRDATKTMSELTNQMAPSGSPSGGAGNVAKLTYPQLRKRLDEALKDIKTLDADQSLTDVERMQSALKHFDLVLVSFDMKLSRALEIDEGEVVYSMLARTSLPMEITAYEVTPPAFSVGKDAGLIQGQFDILSWFRTWFHKNPHGLDGSEYIDVKLRVDKPGNAKQPAELRGEYTPTGALKFKVSKVSKK